MEEREIIGALVPFKGKGLGFFNGSGFRPMSNDIGLNPECGRALVGGNRKK
jgi:hypothetical protein